MGKRKDSGRDSGRDSADSPGRRRKSGGGGLTENVRTLVYALAIALFIRTFLVQAFRIPSGSMEETLLIGDFLLVDKVTFGARVPGTSWRLPGFREPRRGDILVFKDPRTNRDFIKRCIGEGGETLEVVDNQVFIDGTPLEEPYKQVNPRLRSNLSNFPYQTAARQLVKPWVVQERLQTGQPSEGPPTGYRIPDGQVFMMGDNRNNSADSREWGGLQKRRVVGRAFVLYWSSDPVHAPEWVKRMPETWVKGFFQLFLGRPRLSRLGTWLAQNHTDTYGLGAPAAVSTNGDE